MRKIVLASVIDDALNRIKDWLLSGGKVTDSYVEKQLKYIEKIREMK